MTNYTKFSKLAISAALALTTASSISFAGGKAPVKAKEATNKDGAAVSGKITLKAPSKESRKTASSDELKMNDKDLRAALMKMRYCIAYDENDTPYRITFHHNNVVTLKFTQDGAYGGDSYGGNSYGGDSYGGDSYGGEPYGGEGAGKATSKSSWKIKGGKVIVNLNGGSDQTLYLTKSGLAKHRCN